MQVKKPQFDLVCHRDDSLTKGLLSVNTLNGRIKVPLHTEGLETYFAGTWTFGTAAFVNKYGKWFLHIPVSKEIEDMDRNKINQVIGMDRGVNSIAATYDSNGQTRFFDGKDIKHKRGEYKAMRKERQHRQALSAAACTR